MSYKKVSIAVMSLLIVLGAIGIWFSTQITVAPSSGYIGGTQFYPTLLCSLIILFSAIALVGAIRMPDNRYIELPNMKYYVIILAITVAWVALWQTIGMFYIVSYVMVGLVLYILNPAEYSLKKVRNTLIIDAILVGCGYLIFDVALGLSL